MITRDMENTIAVTADVIINREYSILLRSRHENYKRDTKENDVF